MTHKEVLDEVNVIYERISNNENNLFSDGKYTEALEILIDFYETGLIEELEKLKAELEPLPITDTAIRLVSELINNHIAELKGE